MGLRATTSQPSSHWASPESNLERAGHLTPSIQSSTHAPTGSLNFDRASSTWGCWTGTDSDLFDFGGNAFEPSWLVGGGFDINALTSSISATGSPWGYAELPTNLIQTQASSPPDGDPGKGNSATDNRNNVRNVVRSRWYTWPTVEGTYPYTTSQLRNQDHVDEAYRADLSNRLRPGPPPSDNILPSTDFLVRSAILLKYARRTRADSAVEYMHQAVLCQVSPNPAHRPCAIVSTLVRECPSAPFYMLCRGTIRGLTQRCCSWQGHFHEAQQGYSSIRMF